MEEIKLYSAKVCPFTHRSRLALALKGLDYVLVDIDLRNKPSWYAELNPMLAVPALVQGDFVLTESLVINEYINELADTPALLPADPQQRALVRVCIANAETNFMPSFYRLLKALADEAQAKAGARMLEALCQINEVLEKAAGPYLFGATLTLADIAIYPWFERWPVLQHYRGLEIPEALYALRRWIEAMQNHACVQQLLGDTDYFVNEYRDYASGAKL